MKIALGADHAGFPGKEKMHVNEELFSHVIERYQKHEQFQDAEFARKCIMDNRHNAITQEADYADGFHVFSVEWMPDAVRHYIDGELVADRDFQWRHKDGSDGGAAHVLVNLAVGGRWPGPPDAKTLPARLEISHVRVWQGEGDRPPA